MDQRAVKENGNADEDGPWSVTPGAARALRIDNLVGSFEPGK
jgi:hypothetical protein